MLVNNLENILAYSNRLQKEASAGQVGLFGDSLSSETSLKLTLDKAKSKYSESDQLNWERELLGLYLSHHPLQTYTGILSGQTTPISELKTEMEGTSVTIGGSITAIREISTKTGSKMAFIKIADISSEVEVVIFPKVYAKKSNEWQRDLVIIVDGKVDSGRRNGGELKILADKVHLVTEKEAKNYGSEGPYDNTDSTKLGNRSKIVEAVVTNNPVKQANPRLYIRLENSSNQEILLRLKEKIDSYKGKTEVVLVTGPDDSKQIIKLPQSIEINEISLRDVAGLFGATNVVVK